MRFLSKRVEAGEQALQIARTAGAAAPSQLGGVEYPLTNAGNLNAALATPSVWTVGSAAAFEDAFFAEAVSGQLRINLGGWYMVTLTTSVESTGTANCIIGSTIRVNSTAERIKVITNRTAGTSGYPAQGHATFFKLFDIGDLVDVVSVRLGAAGVVNAYSFSGTPVSSLSILFIRTDNI